MRTSAWTATEYRLTKHARLRMQQRAIPLFVVELLIDLANPVDTYDGCTLHRFDRYSWAEARSLVGGSANKLDHYRNACVVLGARGDVVTAFHLN